MPIRYYQQTQQHIGTQTRVTSVLGRKQVQYQDWVKEVPLLQRSNHSINTGFEQLAKGHITVVLSAE